MSKAKAVKGSKTKTTGAPTKPQNGPADVDTIFEAMDLNHDGRISVIELTKAARYLGYNPTKKEAEQMINDCNPSQPGYVTKSEFKRMFKDRQADVDEQIRQVTEAFRVFDKDNSGTISADEIRVVLSKCGEEVDDSEIEDMIKQADVDGDGLISYEEFAVVMCDLG